MKSVLSKNLERVKGREAWRNNLHLSSLVAENIKSIFGPKGGYKIVTYHRGPEQVIKVSKDAIDIVEELGIQFPIIKIIFEAAKMHREETGDGVSSFLILLSELLKEAENLLSKGVHPTIIIKGYREATKKALSIIDNISKESDEYSQEKIWEMIDCGRGLITESWIHDLIEASRLAIKDGEVDIKKIRIVKKKGGATSESKLIRDFIIKKEKIHLGMPDRIENPKIVVVSEKIGIKSTEIKMKGQGPFPIKLNIEDPLKIKEFKTEENRLNNLLIEKIKSVEANVLISKQIISDDIKGGLAKEGIFALMSLEPEEIDAISEATGAKIVGNIEEVSVTDLGKAQVLELENLESEKTTILRGCQGITLVIRGNSSQILDELEKSIRKGVTIMKDIADDKRTVPGGGAIEMHISKELKKYSLKFSGKEQLAIRSFADALEEIPRCLSQNNGQNPLDTIIKLNTLHSNGLNSYGVGKKGCYDMNLLEVKDLARTKKSVLKRAFDVAVMILRIDELIIVKGIAKVHK